MREAKDTTSSEISPTSLNLFDIPPNKGLFSKQYIELFTEQPFYLILKRK